MPTIRLFGFPNIWKAYLSPVRISPRDHSLREGERAEKKNPSPLTVDGARADGSAEGRWRFVFHVFVHTSNEAK